MNHIIDSTGDGIGYGATEVNYSGQAGDGAVVQVYYRDDLSSSDRDRLADHLRTLPGVTRITVCGRGTPGC